MCDQFSKHHIQAQLVVAAHGRQRHHCVVFAWSDQHAPCFAGEERWLARGYTAACICLSLGTTTLLVRVSYAQRNFETAMSGKDTGAHGH